MIHPVNTFAWDDRDRAVFAGGSYTVYVRVGEMWLSMARSEFIRYLAGRLNGLDRPIVSYEAFLLKRPPVSNSQWVELDDFDPRINKWGHYPEPDLWGIEWLAIVLKAQLNKTVE